jgi:hydroxymethylpyrimidine pyrophosphatase-like HAD family hydrolase
VKPRVLALDFDGTIAVEGTIDPVVAAAIQEARDVGLLAVLVTGRMLTDLGAVFRTPPLFDAIVAENGAVLRLPNLLTPITLSQEPDPRFLAELRRRGIRYQTGQCVVEAAADAAPQVIEIIRGLGLPLAITFNLGRLMVLPHGVSKASGLQEALWRLRTSVHNAVAIGNAENDHQLIEACEIGAAVAWGSEALRRSADEVVPGNGPGAVARYIRDILSLPRIPPERMGRRRMRLGTLSTGEPLDLAIRGRNFLVGGDPKSGKSWMAGLLCEQLILQRYSLCILDPEGDYTCLEALPGVIVQPVGGKEGLFLGLERVLTHPDLSLVVDMSAAPREEKPRLVRQLLEAINRLRRATGLPHRVVVDEAHYFLNRLDDPELFDHELGGYLLVTYRISDLSPDILRASEAVIVTRVDDRGQALALLALAPGAGTPSEWMALLADLAIDEAVLLPGTLETGDSTKRFRVAPRLTAHVRHRVKYADVPVCLEREFVFTQGGRPTGERARTVRDLLSALPKLPDDVVRGHLARGDFRHWIEDVFGDRELGAAILHLEQRDVSNGRDALQRAIADRYGETRRDPLRTAQDAPVSRTLDRTA